MALRQTAHFEAVKLLADRAPALSDALDQALAVMQQQPTTVAERRNLDRVDVIASAWKEVLGAMKELAKISESAAEEQKSTLRENDALRARVAELEADLRAWQEEYDPDSQPDRPMFFSNIRRALASFRH